MKDATRIRLDTLRACCTKRRERGEFVKPFWTRQASGKVPFTSCHRLLMLRRRRGDPWPPGRSPPRETLLYGGELRRKSRRDRPTRTTLAATATMACLELTRVSSPARVCAEKKTCTLRRNRFRAASVRLEPIGDGDANRWGSGLRALTRRASKTSKRSDGEEKRREC